MNQSFLPVICVGNDLQEADFEDEARFAETDGLPIPVGDDPMTIRLSVRYRGRLHVTLSRIFLWEQSKVSVSSFQRVS